jgi:hypothetical protein
MSSEFIDAIYQRINNALTNERFLTVRRVATTTLSSPFDHAVRVGYYHNREIIVPIAEKGLSEGLKLKDKSFEPSFRKKKMYAFIMSPYTLMFNNHILLESDRQSKEEVSNKIKIEFRKLWN